MGSLVMMGRSDGRRLERWWRTGRVEGWLLFMLSMGSIVLSIVLLASTGCGRHEPKPARPPEIHVFSIDDYEYVRRKFFFLTDPDGPPMNANGLGTLGRDSVEVWNGDGNAHSDRKATRAYVTLDGLVSTVHDSIAAGRAAFGRFDRLSAGKDYTVEDGVYPGYPVLVLSDSQVHGQGSRALAVAYKTSLRRVGGPIPDSAGVLVLKLIRPAAGMGGTLATDPTQGIFAASAKLELRNVYDLGHGRTPDGLIVRVRRKGDFDTVRDPDRIGDHTLLEILGLDLYTERGGKRTIGPDGRIDRGWIDYDSGYLFFRDLHPFAPTAGDKALRMGAPDPPRPDTLVEKAPEIYKRDAWTKEMADRASKYRIEVTARGGGGDPRIQQGEGR